MTEKQRTKVVGEAFDMVQSIQEKAYSIHTMLCAIIADQNVTIEELTNDNDGNRYVVRRLEGIIDKIAKENGELRDANELLHRELESRPVASCEMAFLLNTNAKQAEIIEEMMEERRKMCEIINGKEEVLEPAPEPKPHKDDGIPATSKHRKRATMKDHRANYPEVFVQIDEENNNPPWWYVETRDLLRKYIDRAGISNWTKFPLDKFVDGQGNRLYKHTCSYSRIDRYFATFNEKSKTKIMRSITKNKAKLLCAALEQQLALIKKEQPELELN